MQIIQLYTIYICIYMLLLLVEHWVWVYNAKGKGTDGGVDGMS